MMRVILAILLSWNLAFATAYHVSTAGNDSNDGLNSTPAHAWRTFGKAASTMAAGDSVAAATGTYSERITLTISGTAGNYIEYKAEPGASPSIDATGTGTGEAIRVNNISYIKFTNIIATGTSGSCPFGQPCSGLFVGGTSTHIKVSGGRYHHNAGSGVLFDSTASAAHFSGVDGAEIDHNNQGGMTIWENYSGSNITTGGYEYVTNNNIHDNIGSGNFDCIQIGGGAATAPHHVYVAGNSVNCVLSGGADQLDMGGHGYGDHYLAEDNDLTGSGGDFKCQQGWGGSHLACRGNVLHGGPGIQGYEFPSPTTMFNNTIVDATHCFFPSNAVVTVGVSTPMTWGGFTCNGGSFDGALCSPSPSTGTWSPGGDSITCTGGTCNGPELGFVFKNNLCVNNSSTGYLYNMFACVSNKCLMDVTYKSIKMTNNIDIFNTGGKGLIWDQGGAPNIYNAQSSLTAWQNYQNNGTDHQDIDSTRLLNTTWNLTNLFVNAAGGDYTPKGGSPMIGAGAALTTTTAGGTGVSVIPVDRATYFFDQICTGGECLRSAADLIRVGSCANADHTIADGGVNVRGKTLTITDTVTFSNGDGVFLSKFCGSAGQVVGAKTENAISTTTTTSTSTTSTSILPKTAQGIITTGSSVR